MLHTLDFAAPPSADEVLRAMFAARKHVFVDLLRWNVPVVNGAFELDQFDNEHATYLVLAEPDGQHMGSARLLPTCRPHILDSLYPDLCADDPPAAPDVLEITSEVLTPRRRNTARDQTSVWPRSRKVGNHPKRTKSDLLAAFGSIVLPM